MAEQSMKLADLLTRLEVLAAEALALWDLPPGAGARLLNVAENVTYLVEAPGGFRAVLRAHRPGYHSRQAIESELAWISALDRAGAVAVPAFYTGRDGQAIQRVAGAGLAPRFLVLFHFVEGAAPDEAGDLTADFGALGAIAARTHLHAIDWPRPEGFERLTWDLEQIFGADPTWGDWRAAPGVSGTFRLVLERVETAIRNRLEAFGRGPDRYGLIHADMRLANLLVDRTGTKLIDFDDCGFGWFLYDFAAGISFIENDPRVPALKAAWVRGYRTVRTLADEEVAEIDTFVMLRRMALLAWIGSHIEAPEPQALAPRFAADTVRLGQDWIDRLEG